MSIAPHELIVDVYIDLFAIDKVKALRNAVAYRSIDRENRSFSPRETPSQIHRCVFQNFKADSLAQISLSRAKFRDSIVVNKNIRETESLVDRTYVFADSTAHNIWTLLRVLSPMPAGLV